VVAWWRKARLDPLDEGWQEWYDSVVQDLVNRQRLSEFMATQSLIQIYLCAAQAKLFFTYDFLRPLKQERHVRDTGKYPPGREWEAPYPINLGRQVFSSTQYKIKDNVGHRTLRPLQAAMELCDLIKPGELVYCVADYLATLIPLYVSCKFKVRRAATFRPFTR